MITFRNSAEAQSHAALHRPYQTACQPPGESYGLRYGARADRAAEHCRAAFARGDARALQIHQHALSLLLFADQPQLFDVRRRA